jgi:hypothetical protein
MIDIKSNVFDLTTGRKVVTMGDNTTTFLPRSGKEYLVVVKKTLTHDDYCDVLLGIMDPEIYHTIEPSLQKIVESYFTFD